MKNKLPILLLIFIFCSPFSLSQNCGNTFGMPDALLQNCGNKSGVPDALPQNCRNELGTPDALPQVCGIYFSMRLTPGLYK